MNFSFEQRQKKNRQQQQQTNERTGEQMNTHKKKLMLLQRKMFPFVWTEPWRKFVYMCMRLAHLDVAAPIRHKCDSFCFHVYHYLFVFGFEI